MQTSSGFLLAIAAMFSASAAAADAAAPDAAAADKLFREARAAARAGDHASACPKFRASYALDPAPGALFNVADCDEHEGHLVDALRRFEEGLGRLDPADARLPYIRSRVHILEGRVPQIAGTLGPGIAVFVDGIDTSNGEPGASSTFSRRVDPGTHELRVLGPVREERLVVVLKEGEIREVDVARLVAPSASEPGSVAAPATLTSPRSSDQDASSPWLTLLPDFDANDMRQLDSPLRDSPQLPSPQPRRGRKAPRPKPGQVVKADASTQPSTRRFDRAGAATAESRTPSPGGSRRIDGDASTPRRAGCSRPDR